MSSDPSGGSRAPLGPTEMLGESDWDDEDLLTIAEASERLAQEVDRARTRARMIQDLLDSGAEGTTDRAALESRAAAELQRAAELAAAADRIRAARARAPEPRR